MGQTGFLGEIRMFGGNFAPRSWAFCHGQLLSIAQNTALFSIIGTIYGGDGRTTFALPDLRGRAPISTGTGPGLPTFREGSRSGEATHTLNLLELPAHSHMVASTPLSGNVQIGANSDSPGASDPTGGVTFGNTGTDTIYNEEDPTTPNSINGITNDLLANVQLQNQGGNRAHENMQPYLAVNYIIATQGTFPSRN